MKNVDAIDLIIFTGRDAVPLYRSGIPLKDGFIEFGKLPYDFSMLRPMNCDDGKVRYLLPIESVDLLENIQMQQMRERITFADVVEASDSRGFSKMMDWFKSLIIAVLLWLAYSNASDAVDIATRNQVAIDQVNSTLAKPLVIGK